MLRVLIVILLCTFWSVSASPPTYCWAQASDPDNHWCGGDHPGQANYTASSTDGTPYADYWQEDVANGNGWRFCDLEELGPVLDVCKEACIALGGCAELSLTNNGCCFPAQTQCFGNKRQGDTKYIVVDCPPPPPQPLAPPLPPIPPPLQPDRHLAKQVIKTGSTTIVVAALIKKLTEAPPPEAPPPDAPTFSHPTAPSIPPLA